MHLYIIFMWGLCGWHSACATANRLDGTAAVATATDSLLPAAATDSGLPTAATDAATDSGLPTTATDAATDRLLPTTATDSLLPAAATDSGLPTAATDAATDSLLPAAATDSGLPTAATDSGLPTAATDAATDSLLPAAATDSGLPTVSTDRLLPTTATDSGLPTVTTGASTDAVLQPRMLWPQLSTSIVDLLSMKMNIIAGIPLAIAASIFDLVCSSTLQLHQVPAKYTPDITKMNFHYVTACRNYSVPLLAAETLWLHEAFDRTKKVVIVATGWKTSIADSTTAELLTKAFLCRDDVNLIIVDAAKYVDTLYKWATLNTDEIGRHVAKGLWQLVKVVPLRNIHLIGHSLGAHIMGAAGRHFRRLTGQQIPRITGLDAAKPCFYSNDTIMSLKRGDALFTDAIHSNNGIAGKREPYADADYYPGGVHPLPKGCLDVACAHQRASEYFSESVYPGNERNFVAHRCGTWRELKRMACGADAPATTMGYAASRQAAGIFLVDTNRVAPYGTHAHSTTAAWLSYRCHVCQR